MATEKFHFTVDGTTVTLPKFSNLPFGVARKIRKEKDEEQIFVLIEELLKKDKKTLDFIDTLTVEQVGDLFVAWQKDAGVTVGESPEQ